MTYLPLRILTFTAALSLATSIVLGAMPFLSPATPVAPLMYLNFALAMTVGQLAMRPFGRLGRWAPSVKPRRHNSKVFAAVFLTFTIAGWVAILSGAKMT